MSQMSIPKRENYNRADWRKFMFSGRLRSKHTRSAHNRGVRKLIED